MPFQEARDAADARERFVWVDDDGSVRELSPEECAFLATPFEGVDGGRPYVKERYRSLTPDGRMRGFLELRQLPSELHHRVRRGGSAPGVGRRRFPSRRVIGSTLGAILVTALVGYLAFLVGAFIATSFRQPAIRGLDAVAFVFAVFFALVVYLLTCISIILKFAERWANLALVASATGLIGFFSGAAWVLWLHGDPSRILLIRTIP